jgi:geranylgeranyl pyrophosphate synthase
MKLPSLKEAFAAVEERLMAVVETDVLTLEEASQHIISSGGKRVRPQILLLSYAACGGTMPLQAVDLAAAVEMVHTATLVHDDINDHSDFRRGKMAVHKRWGRTFALLAGDFLFTKVYELMAPYGNPFNVMMADACVKLVEGETLQAHAAKTGEIDRETYKKIIARKTASLFEVGARMGAAFGGATESTVEAFREYGYNLGMAFQIVDDILDVIGDPEALGKPVGLDVAQNRGVMVAEGGVAVMGNGHTAVAELPDEDPVKRMMMRMRESGAIELARMQAIELANRARQALAIVPSSPAKAELLGLVDLVVDRTA